MDLLHVCLFTCLRIGQLSLDNWRFSSTVNNLHIQARETYGRVHTAQSPHNGFNNFTTGQRLGGQVQAGRQVELHVQNLRAQDQGRQSRRDERQGEAHVPAVH